MPALAFHVQTLCDVNADQLRLAMRQWPCGVTIVSSHFQGEQHGMTVSAFTSLCLEPPMVLVSLKRGARTERLVRQGGVFGVSILAAGQHEISDRFAGRTHDNLDRFARLATFTLKTGAPLLLAGLSAFDCQVAKRLDVGSHTLYVGHVVAVRLGAGDDPLLYYNCDYRRIC